LFATRSGRGLVAVVVGAATSAGRRGADGDEQQDGDDHEHDDDDDERDPIDRAQSLGFYVFAERLSSYKTSKLAEPFANLFRATSSNTSPTLSPRASQS